jgi:hypothetical protein
VSKNQKDSRVDLASRQLFGRSTAHLRRITQQLQRQYDAQGDLDFYGTLKSIFSESDSATIRFVLTEEGEIKLVFAPEHGPARTYTYTPGWDRLLTTAFLEQLSADQIRFSAIISILAPDKSVTVRDAVHSAKSVLAGPAMGHLSESRLSELVQCSLEQRTRQIVGLYNGDSSAVIRAARDRLAVTSTMHPKTAIGLARQLWGSEHPDRYQQAVAQLEDGETVADFDPIGKYDKENALLIRRLQKVRERFKNTFSSSQRKLLTALCTKGRLPSSLEINEIALGISGMPETRAALLANLNWNHFGYASAAKKWNLLRPIIKDEYERGVANAYLRVWLRSPRDHIATSAVSEQDILEKLSKIGEKFGEGVLTELAISDWPQNVDKSEVILQAIADADSLEPNQAFVFVHLVGENRFDCYGRMVFESGGDIPQGWEAMMAVAGEIAGSLPSVVEVPIDAQDKIKSTIHLWGFAQSKQLKAESELGLVLESLQLDQIAEQA